MTLSKIQKTFGIPPDRLRQLASWGLIRRCEATSAAEAYADDDLAHLGLIDTLMNTGFSPDEIKAYLAMNERGTADERMVLLLRQKRRLLLDCIHGKQQLLERLDYLIWEQQKGKRESNGSN